MSDRYVSPIGIGTVEGECYGWGLCSSPPSHSTVIARQLTVIHVSPSSGTAEGYGRGRGSIPTTTGHVAYGHTAP
jgi:hypothetical protein